MSIGTVIWKFSLTQSKKNIMLCPGEDLPAIELLFRIPQTFPTMSI
jgi:hypothetical protein